jgi:hypothetical protein
MPYGIRLGRGGSRIAPADAGEIAGTTVAFSHTIEAQNAEWNPATREITFPS